MKGNRGTNRFGDVGLRLEAAVEADGGFIISALRDGLDNLGARHVLIRRVAQQRRDKGGSVRHIGGIVGAVEHVVGKHGSDEAGQVIGLQDQGGIEDVPERVVGRGQDGDVVGVLEAVEDGGVVAEELCMVTCQSIPNEIHPAHELLTPQDGEVILTLDDIDKTSGVVLGQGSAGKETRQDVRDLHDVGGGGWGKVMFLASRMLRKRQACGDSRAATQVMGSVWDRSGSPSRKGGGVSCRYVRRASVLGPQTCRLTQP